MKRPWWSPLAGLRRWLHGLPAIIRPLGGLCLLGALGTLSPAGALARADTSPGALERANRLLGPPALPTLPSRDWSAHPTRHSAPPPLLERLMKDPLHAAYHVGQIELAIRDTLDDPAALTLIAAQLGGHDLWRSSAHLDASEEQLAHHGAVLEHAPLRNELARLLTAIA